jgi:hypothetical protein
VNLISSVVLGLALLTVSAVAIVTFAHNYDNSRPVLRQSFESLNTININDIKDLKGNIVSLQYNKSSTPIGILSGKWRLAQVLANNTNTSKPDIVFTTNMTITGVDGLDSHKYQLREFKNLNITLTGKTAIINGTVSLILKSPPAYSASMSIRIMNLETISINIDKNLARHYFGDTPIYGTISS